MEYARVEGASEWRIFMHIALPMLTPAIFSLAILTFMNTWNEFLWTIIITTKKEMLTVTALLRSIGDASLNGGFGSLLAATTLSTLPIIALYLIFHQKLIQGILDGMGKE
jgi:ABC-type glycerol-3-phosphate transport system permease component